MASILFSRIRLRRGLKADLPGLISSTPFLPMQIGPSTPTPAPLIPASPPLMGAELGWCSDTQELFIGNGALADGAPVIGNTQILTATRSFNSFLLGQAVPILATASNFALLAGTSVTNTGPSHITGDVGAITSISPGSSPSILLTAANFAVLAGASITNTGSSVITGDVGAVSSITPGPWTVTGTVHTVDDTATQQALTDATSAYNTLSILTATTLTGDLGGQTLVSNGVTNGVYKYSSSAGLTGTVTLDFGGLSNQRIVIITGSTLTTASASVVNVINNTGTGNSIFWVIGSSATLGTTTSFVGTILAQASISFTTGANMANGNAIALTGSVTMQDDAINIPSNSPSWTVTGTVHTVDDAATIQALSDAEEVYDALSILPPPGQYIPLVSDLGGQTLMPGVYDYASSATLTGTLTLDFQGLSYQQIVIIIGSTLTTASNSHVTVINSDATNRVYWIVGSSATLGMSSTFAGNILAQNNIIINNSASISTILGGSAVSLSGSITIQNDNIAIPIGPNPLEPVPTSSAFLTIPSSIGSAEVVKYTLVQSNVIGTGGFASPNTVIGAPVAPVPTAPTATLNTAANFAVLAGASITNTGSSVITGDVGATSSITPGPWVVHGTVHTVNDAATIHALTDATSAYNTLSVLSATTLTGDLGGQTLTSNNVTNGVYSYSSSAGLTGTLTLDFGGLSNQRIVIITGSTLTTASASHVNVINNTGTNNNIFWVIGSSATLGTTTSFVGTILAQVSITVTTGATIANGSALALTGSVTLDTNTITIMSGTPGIPGINGILGIDSNPTTASKIIQDITYTALTPGLNGNAITIEYTTAPTALEIAPVSATNLLGGTVSIHASLLLQDITYTAVNVGTAGNLISIAYTTGGTAGSEVVTVTGGNAISVQIASGVSTTTQIIAAITSSVTASALVTAIREPVVTVVGNAISVQIQPGISTAAEIASAITNSVVPSPLHTAANFGVLAGASITNTGATHITGDAGAVSSITTGGWTVTGTVHTLNDTLTQQALTDGTNAYNTLSVLSATTLVGDLGGQTLTPGVYKYTSSANITGTLTLDFQNLSYQQIIIITGSTLTTASSAVVDVINSNPTNKIFWVVGSSATIGTTASFVGSILAHTSVSLNTGATVAEGSVIALTGSVTLETNTVAIASIVYTSSTLVTAIANLPSAVETSPVIPTNLVGGTGINVSQTETLAQIAAAINADNIPNVVAEIVHVGSLYYLQLTDMSGAVILISSESTPALLAALGITQGIQEPIAVQMGTLSLIQSSSSTVSITDINNASSPTNVTFSAAVSSSPGTIKLYYTSSGAASIMSYKIEQWP